LHCWLRAAKPKLPLPKGSTLLTVGWGWTVANRPSEAQKLQQVKRCSHTLQG
jgi:hypothetical protein